MPYNPAIPAPATQVLTDVANMEENFDQLDAGLDLANEHEITNYGVGLGDRLMAVTHRLGSGRLYTDDRGVAAPTPPAANDAGRIWRNTEANYDGQIYIHDGTDWVPSASSRNWRVSANGAIALVTNGAWQNYDANLDLTVFLDTNALGAGYTGGWVYRLNLSLNWEIIGAADHIEVRIRKVNAAARNIDYFVLFPRAINDYVLVQRSVLYETAVAAEQVDLEVQVWVTAGMTINRATTPAGGSGAGLTSLDYLSVEEVPAP